MTMTEKGGENDCKTFFNITVELHSVEITKIL